MNKPLSGQVGIITGGSDGIGRAVADLLAERGVTVIICARRAEKLEKVRAAAGGSMEAIRQAWRSSRVRRASASTTSRRKPPGLRRCR